MISEARKKELEKNSTDLTMEFLKIFVEKLNELSLDGFESVHVINAVCISVYGSIIEEFFHICERHVYSYADLPVVEQVRALNLMKRDSAKAFMAGVKNLAEYIEKIYNDAGSI